MMRKKPGGFESRYLLSLRRRSTTPIVIGVDRHVEPIPACPEGALWVGRQAPVAENP